MNNHSIEEVCMADTKSSKSEIDYSALGLKCGLELHQQLATGRKLFCYCPSELRQDEPMASITRHMRPTLSEMGQYDKAALMEFDKQKTIIYEIYDSVCTYELDETPPFPPDPEAIDLALTIAQLLNMRILDELQVNRKQYLDGSIPTGFQRTMIVGTNGKVKVNDKIYPLAMLALEEDSAREVKDNPDRIIWRVDRLGIPLVEIATKTFSVKDPEEVQDIAQTIGRILRATGKVKRGLGTIRQDLNISIKKGARVEVKGVQELGMIPEYIRLEVERQLGLLAVREEIKSRAIKTSDFKVKPRSCKTLLKKSESSIIRKAIKNKEKIMGIKLVGMRGLLGFKIQEERTFGKELADRVKIIAGIGGIIHTDELPGLGITKKQVNALRDHFDCNENDAVVLAIGPKQRLTQAFKEIMIRLKEAIKGVPEETRHANEDGTSRFERYLGGANRMYPDTDTKPIVISETRITRLEEQLPELPAKREERYKKELGLADEIARTLAVSENAFLFDKLVKKGVDPTLAAVTLEQTIKAMTREGIPVDNLPEEKIETVFNLLVDEKIAKEAIESLLEYFAEHPKDTKEQAITALGLEPLSEEELAEIIDTIIELELDFVKQNKTQAKGKIMGQVMEKVRGRIDGEKVSTVVTNQLEKKIQELEKET
jgi:glutamyl-tRNA(Gln) amidotransferase subunit E